MSGDVVARARELLTPPPCGECGADHSRIMHVEIRDMLAELAPDLLFEAEKRLVALKTIAYLSRAHASACHVIDDHGREKAWLDILSVIERAGIEP